MSDYAEMKRKQQDACKRHDWQDTNTAQISKREQCTKCGLTKWTDPQGKVEIVNDYRTKQTQTN